MIIRNILALNAIYAAKLLLPLALLPVLAHRLTPSGYGVYLYSLSLAAWLSLFIEYGFNIYSTREFGGKDLPAQRAVIAGTQSARLLLALAVMPPALIAALTLRIYAGWQIWAGFAWMIAALIGLSPLYYFQAKERLRVVAVAEVLASTLALVLCYLFVGSDNDMIWLGLASVLSRLLSSAYLTTLMLREMELHWTCFQHPRAGMAFLKKGFHFFILQAAVSLYTSFNVVLLGILRPPEEVAPYAAAERIVKAGLGFIGQASQVIFARLNNQRFSNPLAMVRQRRSALLAMFACGLVGAGVVLVFAGHAARFLFPADPGAVTVLLNTFAVLVPAIALSSVLGLHFMILNHQEALFNRIIVGVALANIFLSYFLINSHGGRGLAVAWVFTEWTITVSLALCVIWAHHRRHTKLTEKNV